MDTVHDRGVLLQYIESSLSDEARRGVDDHLASCPECRAYVDFVLKFNRNLVEGGFIDGGEPEPCPAAEVLLRLAEGTLDEETAKHVRVHTLFCDDCSTELQLFTHAAGREEEEAAVEQPPSTAALSELPPAATPASGWRVGVKGHVAVFLIGGKRYSVFYMVTANGHLHCQVSGPATTISSPAAITIFTETGEPIFSATFEHLADQTIEVALKTTLGNHLLSIKVEGEEVRVPLALTSR